MFDLLEVISDLVAARNSLFQHYNHPLLMFTLDGKLVGDIGEAIAVELFGITLLQGIGIDGHAQDGRSVQVKATGTNLGPNFRHLPERAQHLLFFSLNFENLTGEIIFNGPEQIALHRLPDVWQNQRQVTWNQINAANNDVDDGDRLNRIDV